MRVNAAMCKEIVPGERLEQVSNLYGKLPFSQAPAEQNRGILTLLPLHLSLPAVAYSKVSGFGSRSGPDLARSEANRSARDT
jgi:hypothetical protein